jgi:hypothetical protein
MGLIIHAFVISVRVLHVSSVIATFLGDKNYQVIRYAIYWILLLQLILFLFVGKGILLSTVT